MPEEQSQSTTKRKICPKCDYEDRAGLLVCPFDGVSLVTQGKDNFIGQTIAEKYEILSLLGRGGMSVVYKAKHLMMNRHVAVKMLRPELVAVPQLLERFKIETNAVASLRHNSIVTVFDYGLLPNGTPYLIMDYLEGEPLNDILKQCKRMEPDRAIPLFAQACDALAHAHDTGVIHRDIKPGNLLIRKDPKSGNEMLTIFDFGIAKVLGQDGSTIHKLTTSGEVFGSPLYMSPEQCSGDRIGTASDTYSLACVFYEALSGKPPLAGSSPMDTLMKHINEDPEPFKEGLNIPPKLQTCIMTALNKAPEDRQPHIRQFRDEILDAGGLRYNPSLQNTLEQTIQPRNQVPVPDTKIIAQAGDASGSGNTYQAPAYEVKASAGYKKVTPSTSNSSPAQQAKAKTSTAIIAAAVAIVLIGGVGFLAYQKFQTQVIIVPDETETGSSDTSDTKPPDTKDSGTSTSSGTDSSSTSGTDSSTTTTGTETSTTSGTDTSSENGENGTDTASTTTTPDTTSTAITPDTAKPVNITATAPRTDQSLLLNQNVIMSTALTLGGRLKTDPPEPLLSSSKEREEGYDKCEIIPVILDPSSASAKQAADAVYKQLFEKTSKWKPVTLAINGKYKDIVVQELNFPDSSKKKVKEFIVYIKNPTSPELLIGCQFVPQKATEAEMHDVINAFIPKLHDILTH